jgi:hypothetical protein
MCFLRELDNTASLKRGRNGAISGLSRSGIQKSLSEAAQMTRRAVRVDSEASRETYLETGDAEELLRALASHPPRALRVQVVVSPAPWERLDLRVRMADEAQRPPPKVDTIGTTQRVIAAERVPEVFAQITVDGHGSPLL